MHLKKPKMRGSNGPPKSLKDPPKWSLKEPKLGQLKSALNGAQISI